MANPERLILVDGSALSYRAYYAIPATFQTASGLPTNATYGFATMFRKVLSGRTPELGAVVFDAPGKTFRDEKYPAYKAQRPRMDDLLRRQLPSIDRVVEAHRFKVLRVFGYEADDVIGTLTGQAVEAGMEVFIISGDKDFAQLISERARMVDTLRDVVFDPELVRKKWGVVPAQFVDLLAMTGDKVDNIPGVPLANADGLGKPALERLRPWLEDPARPKITHNAKFLRTTLLRHGVNLAGITGDALLESFLVEPVKVIPHRLAQISREYLQRTLPPAKRILGSGKKQRLFSQLGREELTAWACQRADTIAQAWPILRGRLDDLDLVRYFEEVELPLSWVLAAMELDGIAVDPEDLKLMGEELRGQLAGLEATIFKLAGSEFNVGSHQQLGKVLFEDLGLPVIKRTKSGYSTAADVLTRLVPKHEIASHLLEHRKLAKLINTYTDVLQREVNPATGRIHATFQQTVGATGRLITTDPDLQRTPIRTPEGKRIRKSFVPRAGWTMISADWSQIELRLLAHCTRDPLLLEAFASGPRRCGCGRRRRQLGSGSLTCTSAVSLASFARTVGGEPDLVARRPRPAARGRPAPSRGRRFRGRRGWKQQRRCVVGSPLAVEVVLVELDLPRATGQTAEEKQQAVGTGVEKVEPSRPAALLQAIDLVADRFRETERVPAVRNRQQPGTLRGLEFDHPLDSRKICPDVLLDRSQDRAGRTDGESDFDPVPAQRMVLYLPGRRTRRLRVVDAPVFGAPGRPLPYRDLDPRLHAHQITGGESDALVGGQVEVDRPLPGQLLLQESCQAAVDLRPADLRQGVATAKKPTQR